MSDPSARLLQLLEPAVRPGPAAPRPATPRGDASAAPFEGKSFDQLLREIEPAGPSPAAPATQVSSAPEATSPRDAAPPDWLAPLNTVENASLARLLGGHDLPTA